MKTLNLFVLILFIALYNCSSSDDNSPQPESVTITDVYVAGSLNKKAVYYKNNELVELSQGVQNIQDYVLDIYVTPSGDVHAVGKVYEQGNSPTYYYWLNGVATDISGNGEPRKIKVTNTGYVYILTGNGYLLNGVFNTLPMEIISDIAIDGSNVYVCGATFVNGVYVPTYTINNQLSELPSTTANTWANAIKIENGNVHIVGNERLNNTDFKLIYWQNGVKEELSTNQDAVEVYAVDVVNNNTYIVGTFESEAIPFQGGYWVNSQRQDMLSIAKDAEFYDVMALDNDDVYITGENYTVGFGYWLNAQWVPLNITGTSPSPNAIFVHQYQE